MVLLPVNSSSGLKALIETDSNPAQTPCYSQLQEKQSFGFLLTEHIYLAVSPSPTHGTPCHLHFIQDMFTEGYSTSGTYIAVIRR